MGASSIISVRNISKSFRGITAVDTVSLEVHEGDIFGVLGPNGAGKTTTISMILGLLNPDSGEIKVLNTQVSSFKTSILANVGSLTGDKPAFYPFLTGKENVSYIAKLFNIPTSRVDEVLKFMGIFDAKDRLPQEYSTGMKQRLGIAMSIIKSPKVLILDEPTNGMDPSGMKDMRHLIKDLGKNGITIILCSHLLHEVEQVCNKVAVFNQGKIVLEGLISELYKSEQSICIRTEKVKESLQVLQAFSNISVHSTGESGIEVSGLTSEEIINTLVSESLTPKEIFIIRKNLEDAYVELINNS